MEGGGGGPKIQFHKYLYEIRFLPRVLFPNPVIHVVQHTYLFQAGMTKYVSTTYITGLVLKILVGQVTLGPPP